MTSIAIGILCKTPAAGMSKTRLSPPLAPDECARISACFIRDLAKTIDHVSTYADITPYAVYTPIGSETALRELLSPAFVLQAQCDGDFGARLKNGLACLLGAGHRGAILVNSDSPTLPPDILTAAVKMLDSGDNVTLSPAVDGGYTLIGLSRMHDHLFTDIPWSTSQVYELTCQRAKEIALPVAEVPGWYDVDDAASFAMLQRELLGDGRPPVGSTRGAPSPATRSFLLDRLQYGSSPTW